MNECDIEKVINFFSDKTLLYVEDNKEARDATLEIFEEFFTNIIIGVDGEDGYEKFVANYQKIDLIITDINMPKFNGLEMISKIRQSNLKDIYILVLSAHNETDFFIDSIKVGVNGYLLKPLDIEQFVQTLCFAAEKIGLKKELERNILLLKQYQDIVDEASIVSKTDPRGIITYANKKFCKISGYTKEELEGKNHNIVRHPDMPKEAFKDLWDTIKNKKSIWHGIVKNRKKDGGFYYVDATVGPILDSDGNILEHIALRNDITDIMDPNRQLQDFLKNAKSPFLVYVKIKNFNDYESLYGMDISEKIYNVCKDIILDTAYEVAECKKIFALGNGEYVLSKDLDESYENLLPLVKEFSEKLKNITVVVNDIKYDIATDVVCADGDNALRDARYAVNEANEEERESLFVGGLSKNAKEKAKKNINTIIMIKTALEEDRVISLFQPIVNNKTEDVDKYESLIRIKEKDGTLISPYFFLEIAKQGSYYNALTNRILKNSFEALQKTSKDISINLSAKDIENSKTRESIFDYLQKFENDANRIVFELLESDEIKNFDVIKDFIKHVKSFGVKIAIDDFGSGYSNMERLVEYDPDIIKIDGSLVKNLEYDKRSLSIIKSFLYFAKEQGIQTVGEFVENENIYNILKDIGVDYSQGYYFGKPKNIEEIV